MDIHKYKRRLDCYIERIKNSNEISIENKKLMLDFVNHLFSEGIGVAKIGRYLGDVMKLDRLLKKSFNDTTKEDIKRVVAEINQTDLSEETKRCFKIMLRKFYRFVRNIDEKGIYPEEVKWISLHINGSHRKLPEELINEKELELIVRHCTSIRDRAFVMALAESGCRVSEIALMRIKQITFEEHGARLSVSGKTGARKILVINSTPFLHEWINSHPYNNDPNSPIWCDINGNVLTYTRFAAILKKAAKRAGIKKRVYPHLLRHSRATSLANVMSDAQLKNYLGWTQSSRMSAIYVHMSGKDTDDAILQVNGLEVKREIRDSNLKPKICLKCKTSNPVTGKFCNTCGFVLNKEDSEMVLKMEAEKQYMNELMNKIIQDKDILQILVKKINEMKNINAE